ncbi:cilia- and flagella-associated protein 299-like isoform X1 [Maniola jurtina]|uniref:cilia- and flagella-associated protein 299-like isoform X1 n=1 Tax=Maniola jurtina TaxID=191418 RepID=UPI001E688FD4|nr:cilia- and flagella-associated protein 299-like isoform X1 [Maniola jurtina]
MAEKKNEFPPGIEAYRRLLAFETWEDYLDSLIEIADLRNLRSLASARTVAALGYRANGDTLNEKEFYARRATIHAIVFPVVRPYVLVSEGATIDDPFFRELAVRERANRVGILQSVIFIRHFTKGGFEISGYIDYAHRLISEDWGPYFRNNKMLWPKDSDLGYYHWRHGTVRSNISRNYKPVMDTEKGLLFQNRHDHKIICPDPQQDPGQNTTKQRIYSKRYTQVEIYDHVVRRKT